MISRRTSVLVLLLLAVVVSIGLIQEAPKRYIARAKTSVTLTTEKLADYIGGDGNDAAGRTTQGSTNGEFEQSQSDTEEIELASDPEAEPELFAFVDGLRDQLPQSRNLTIPEWNRYTGNHSGLHTKLFIGFGRNWFMLQQCIISYIAAGWPASDITVFDNSGTMASNSRGLLSIDNPSYVNVTRLNELGVIYERTPAQLTFSQLQNFYLSTALDRGLDYYFWGHMDVAILGDETVLPYKSFYEYILDDLATTTKRLDNWILHFYNFDWLTLISVNSMDRMGAWDTSIPYYTSDCDFYSRVTMWGDEYKNGFELKSIDVHSIYDSLLPLGDLSVFFAQSPDEGLNSARYQTLARTLQHGQNIKGGGDERNRWQNVQTGGTSDPYYKAGWVQDESFRQFNDMGRSIFELKWHTDGACPAFDVGKRLGDMYV